MKHIWKRWLRNLIIGSVTSLAACVPIATSAQPPVITPLVPKTISLAIIVTDQLGRGVPNAAVSVQADNGDAVKNYAPTNADGYTVDTVKADVLYTVSVTADFGKSTKTIQSSVNFDLPVTLARPAPTYPAVHLEVRGHDFVDATGQPTCYSGTDQFIAFRMWLDGRHDELEALVAESHEFGFTWWRVLFQGSKAQNTIFDLSPTEPGYYDQVRAFADWLNARGIGLLAEIFVDNQDVQSPLSHWSRMADLLRGSTTILSGGNEWQKNGFDPQALPDPGMLWTRGSALADVLTPQNGATVASFHQRTDYPATIMDAAASAVFMDANGYTVRMMDEPTRFDQDGSNKSGQPDSPRFAFRLASIYRALWSLVIFHSGAGQRGQLMTPALRTIAFEWTRGLRFSQ